MPKYGCKKVLGNLIHTHRYTFDWLIETNQNDYVVKRQGRSEKNIAH